MIKAARDTVRDTEKDRSKDWYLDIHHLRWVAGGVTTKQAFEAVIVPELKHFQKKGKEYTLCLALIFLDFLKNPEVEERLKDQAVQGLAELLLLQDHDRISNLLNILQKKIKAKPIQEMTKKEDRYWLTHVLILQSIKELLTDNNNSKHFIPVLLETLKTVQKSSPHDDERKMIQEKLNALKSKSAEEAQFVNDLEEFLEPTRGESVEEEEILKAQEELEQAVENKKKIDSEIEMIKSLEGALDELGNEEQKLINDIKGLSSNL